MRPGQTPVYAAMGKLPTTTAGVAVGRGGEIPDAAAHSARRGSIRRDLSTEVVADAGQAGTHLLRPLARQFALLADKHAAIQNLDFVDCEIRGPAVLILIRDIRVHGCGFDTPDPDAMLWEIPESRPVVIGAIAVTGCTFVGCRFRHVGFGGTPATLSGFRGVLSP